MPITAPPSSPYDQNTPDYDGQTPTLEEILAEALRSHTLEMRVALPGKITAVSGNQLVDVQPTIMARYVDDAQAFALPPIADVPVLMPHGQNFSIKFPIAVGDNGLLIFCDRAMDSWQASDGSGPVDPQDTRQHDITDPVFIPGLYPPSAQTTDQTTDLVLFNGTTELHLQQAGTYLFKGNGGQELMTQLDILAAKVAQMASDLNQLAVAVAPGVTTASGPGVFAAVATITQVGVDAAAIQASVQQVQANIDLLKGT